MSKRDLDELGAIGFHGGGALFHCAEHLLHLFTVLLHRVGKLQLYGQPQ